MNRVVTVHPRGPTGRERGRAATTAAARLPSRPVLALAFGAALLGGCIRQRLDPGYAGPVPLSPEVLAPFEYAAGPPAVTTDEIVERDDAFTRRRIELASKVNLLEEHPIIIDYWQIPSPEPAPVIMVLPILGGGNKLANHFAAWFAQHGCAAVVVHRQESYKDTSELELLNPTFRQIVLDHRQAIDWITTRPELDAERIGLMGMSAGAIKGALIWALEDRLRGAVLALAGGDVPYIFSYSREGGIRERRERILERAGITADELYRVMSEEFEHDPLRYARYADARRTLLVLAAFDAAVPYRTGLALREAMGGPETIVLPTGHYGAILYVPYLRAATLRFLGRCFAADGAAREGAARPPAGSWGAPWGRG